MLALADETVITNPGGRLTDLAGFSRLGDEGVDLFLVDSTNAEVPGFVTPEREIGGVLDTVIGKARQRVIVASLTVSAMKRSVTAAPKVWRSPFLAVPEQPPFCSVPIAGAIIPSAPRVPRSMEPRTWLRR